jgi:hypothetical protein
MTFLSTFIARKLYLKISWINFSDNPLIKWLKRQGLQPENYPCEPYIFENTGRGIRATKDLEPGTVVLEIAETVIFTVLFNKN